ADASVMDGHVQAELQRVIGPLGGSIVRDWRGSATLGFQGLPESEDGDQAVLGFVDELPGHATLVDGAWPAEGGASGPIQVVVVDAVAEDLRLAVGDVLTLVAHPAGQTVVVPTRLAGIFAIDAVADPYWNGDEQLIAGMHDNGQYRTFGPFLTTPSDLLEHAGVASVHMRWRTYPNFERLTVDGAPHLRSRVDALPARLRMATGPDFQVATGLPSILRDAVRSLLVSRTGVLLLVAQLAILAAYAIILTASLLVDHRRIDTSLLRSRGAGAPQVALLALAEGLLLAIPAVLVAPWLAVAALSLLNVVGPLAEVHLQIAPRVTFDGYLAAGAAGVTCVALLVLPAVRAAREFAAEQGELSRQETRPFGQRVGLDIALLAVTGIALWQLRLYGAPLTTTVQGSLGLDPLLVAAPAIGLVAGGVLALRILPLLAHGVETAVSRGRDLVGSLGSRQLARRPLRYTRSALLLMLAVSMGVFALSYAATWSTSQRDQAAYQSGADVRVRPGTSLGGLPARALPSAYAGLAGIKQASAVERIADGLSFAAAGSADLLALDADTAAGIVLLRADATTQPFSAMMQALRAGRPEPRLVTLPEGAAYLRMVPRVEIGAQAGVRVAASAILRDADGLLYQVRSGTVAMGGPTTTAIVLPLQGSVAGAGQDGPVQLAALGISLWLPGEVVVTDGVVGVAEVSVSVDPAGPWAELPLASIDAWSGKIALGIDVLADVPPAGMRGTAVQIGGNGPQIAIFATGTGIPSATLSFLPSAVALANGPVPVIANRAFLASTASVVGDTISTTVEGGVQLLSIAGVVETFPTTDPERPLLILDEPTLGLLRLQGTSGARVADEWWMAATDGAAEALSSALRSSPFDSAEVVTVVERTRSLSTDPVALGIIGALTLGFVATGLFAVVGLTVSAAVSARQRRTEFALLRALGLSGRQLSGSLWLENGSLVLVSLLAGTSLGLLIGWMVLPFVTVTQRAGAPVPPVIVHVPWDRILLLELLSGLALGVAVVVIGGVLRRLGVGSILRMGED
ncbi:MAG: ABC transporter permease, partial [Chloroflexota bacterium]|nr:ABC transporter permease [Chloroflexota bacterium]